MLELKIETRYPDHQNAVELFREWATRLEELHPGLNSGPGTYLKWDPRPGQAADALGLVPGSLHGMRVLELGPMEGAHTYQLSKLGAESVLAIEANSHAFLRCLVLKEILQPPNCRFLLGDGLAYLQQNPARFDLIFCSGVLYHMEDPFALVEAMASRSDRIFVWTHYYDPADPKGPVFEPRPVLCDGLELTFYEHAYQQTYAMDLSTQSFWGGVSPRAAWMSREDIVRAFEHFGFAVEVLKDKRNLEAGHHLTLAARRR